MKVKRIISVLLVLIMIFSLVNCQNVIKNTTTKESNNFIKKNLDPAIFDPDYDNDIDCPEGEYGSCEIIENACASGNSDACNYLDSLKHPSPTPTPSSCPQTGTPINPNQLMPPFNNVPSFGTQSFKTKNFRIKDFSSEDIIENVNFLVDRVENVKTIEYKIANFSARGETVNVAELNLELQDAILERDSVKADVLNGLNDYKTLLRNHVNTLMNDPTFSVDEISKPIDLMDYKIYITTYNANYEYLVSLQNIDTTIALLNTLANENKLLIDLINDYLNNLIPNINIVNDINNSELDKVSNSKEAIKFFSSQISFHINKYIIEVKKLEDYLVIYNSIDDEINDYQKIIDVADFYLNNPAPKGFRIKNAGDILTLTGGTAITLGSGIALGAPTAASGLALALVLAGTAYYEYQETQNEQNIESSKQKVKNLRKEIAKRKKAAENKKCDSILKKESSSSDKARSTNSPSWAKPHLKDVIKDLPGKSSQEQAKEVFKRAGKEIKDLKSGDFSKVFKEIKGIKGERK